MGASVFPYMDCVVLATDHDYLPLSDPAALKGPFFGYFALKRNVVPAAPVEK
jgi:hypothetical protein